MIMLAIMIQPHNAMMAVATIRAVQVLDAVVKGQLGIGKLLNAM